MNAWLTLRFLAKLKLSLERYEEIKKFQVMFLCSLINEKRKLPISGDQVIRIM